MALRRLVSMSLFGAATAVLLTACGGSTPASNGAPASKPVATSAAATTPAAIATTQPAAKPAAAKAPTDLASLATKIGCTGYAQQATPAPNADQWGQCTLNGQPVKLYVIPTDAGYQAFLASVKAYGVTEAWMVRTTPFVIAPNDQTQIPAIKAALG